MPQKVVQNGWILSKKVSKRENPKKSQKANIFQKYFIEFRCFVQNTIFYVSTGAPSRENTNSKPVASSESASISGCKIKRILIVAHSAGGWCTTELLDTFASFLKKYDLIRGVAFTDCGDPGVYTSLFVPNFDETKEVIFFIPKKR